MENLDDSLVVTRLAALRGRIELFRQQRVAVAKEIESGLISRQNMDEAVYLRQWLDDKCAELEQEIKAVRERYPAVR